MSFVPSQFALPLAGLLQGNAPLLQEGAHKPKSAPSRAKGPKVRQPS